MKMYKMDLTVALLQDGDKWTVMVGTEGEMLGPVHVKTTEMDDGTTAPRWESVAYAVRVWGDEMTANHSRGDCIASCPLCKGLMPKGTVE